MTPSTIDGSALKVRQAWQGRATALLLAQVGEEVHEKHDGFLPLAPLLRHRCVGGRLTMNATAILA